MSAILDPLPEDLTLAAVARGSPPLTVEDVRAAVAYAAAWGNAGRC